MDRTGSRRVAALRLTSAVRWFAVAALLTAAGTTTWFAQLVFGLRLVGVDAALVGAFVAALAVPLAVADAPRAHERGGRRRWVAVRLVALSLLGGGLGLLLRDGLWPVDAAAHEVDRAVTYSWWAFGAGAALLALEPALALVRLGATRLLGPPASRAARNGDTPGATPRWPGDRRVLWAVALVALAAAAVPAAALIERAHWRIHVDTTVAATPAVAAGTVGARDVVLVPYTSHALLSLRIDARAAAVDAATGDLLWDVRLERSERMPEYEAVAIGDAGAFLTRGEAGGTATEWVALDAETGRESSTPVPDAVAGRAAWLAEHSADDGVDEKAVDGDVVRTFRYGESRLVFGETGRPAGADAGLRLDCVCDTAPAHLELRVGDQLVDAYPRAAATEDVVAETPAGRVALLLAGPEDKALLLIADRDGFRTANVGDRGRAFGAG